MSETNTLTVINQLEISTGLSPDSQLFINSNPTNNIIGRIGLGALSEYLFVDGDLISNTNGTQSAYNLSPAFEFVAPSVAGAAGTFDLATVSAGEVLGASVNGAPRALAMSPLLDAAFSSVAGGVLFRGPTGWQALGPAAEAGYVLAAGPSAASVLWEPSAAGPAIPADAALLGTTGTSTFQGLTLGANLALAGTTLSAAGSAWALSDGTHVVEDLSTLLVPGAVVSGTAGSATLTLEGAPWSISDGSTTITAVSQLQLAGAVSLTGTAGVAMVSVSGGSGGPTYTAGANISLSDNSIAFNPVGLPVPFTIFAPGTLTANQILWSAKFPYGITLPEDLSGWQMESVEGTATAATSLSLTVAGTEVVTFNFPPGGQTGTISNLGTSAVLIAANTRLQLLASGTVDTTLAGLETTLLFQRS